MFGGGVKCLLVIEHLLEKPYNDREVLPLVVGGEEDGVFIVVLRHCGSRKWGWMENVCDVQVSSLLAKRVTVVGVATRMDESRTRWRGSSCGELYVLAECLRPTLRFDDDHRGVRLVQTTETTIRRLE